ncbi:hypothetical protein HXX76_014093 [Chlamydomonas incerta]|uniref:Uncharacterized protein n=1 Tax=Chlamydomonas incerta TaxID=51695 RepID=A0A835SQG8_CHLIN|nr:hypothetical protein HXX76_014093 [Chlamydomonas incerta]|eukprot:KAG2424935.1 hypothetical protein HXX76_014093 [Chlamydomonas incerta]
MTKNTELNRDLILASLSRFYAHQDNLACFKEMTDGVAVSLRLVDWFVTNYCKKHNVEFVQRNSRYNVYVDYRSQLKAFSKHNFDPFRRRDRIRYFYNDTEFIFTTVGQLNFFKWAIENGIVEYINNNRAAIEQDMTASYKVTGGGKGAPPSSGSASPAAPSSSAGRKKRSELSKCCLKKINIHSMQRCLAFD